MKIRRGKTTEDESVAVDETSAGDRELYERLKETVKNIIDDKLLRALCTYRWGGLSKDDVTDERIMSEVQAILQRVKNDTLPDVDHLFNKKLRLDMSELDVSERMLKYFMQCNQSIGENGLVVCFEGEHGWKDKCKLLVESLSPNELKLDVNNTICFQALAALKEEYKLHDLILAKALEQDRDFMRRKRVRYDEPFARAEKKNNT
ncbi:hypothetical protein ON010_g3596 [Phytophthora cinnamomi]|nr:hypothetical protein ON010_g3596 [Phytophthora cinnamomi]